MHCFAVHRGRRDTEPDLETAAETSSMFHLTIASRLRSHIARFAVWWRTLLKATRQDWVWTLTLAVFLAALTGTLAMAMGEVANTAIVQMVAKLLARAQPLLMP